MSQQARRASQGAQQEHGGQRSRSGAGLLSRFISWATSKSRERFIAGVPARIMRPRLAFLCCLAAVLAFGLLMVYSASSVEALSEYGDPMYFLIRQAAFIGIGIALMFAISRLPLERLRSGAVWVLWGILMVTLLLVLLIGERHGGATRWIKIAGIQVQPSELGKAVIIVTASKIFYEYYEKRSLDTNTFLFLLLACALVPLALIIFEPDLGTCLIIGGTIFAMCYFAGFSYRLLIPLVGFLAVIALVLVFASGYRSARVMSDPWADPYGDGYQATLAIMAFASGGLFGRGIGNSTMKYNYLPEAHNDYILAIIGEELGFVGMLLFIAIYLGMIIAAFKIAVQAPTLQGRLIAYGSAVILMLQFLVNALGILGVTPMTGKTMPFISYGGSSMIASLAVAGLIWAVSRSSYERTVYDRRRESISIVDEASSARIEGSTAGEPTRRSARRDRSDLSVVSGGRGNASRRTAPTPRPAPASGRSRPLTPAQSRSGSYERVNLGADPADRLRSQGPRVTGGARRGRPRSNRSSERGRNGR